MEGKAAVILDGTPFVLVMPINAFDLIHTTEDRALRMPYANLVRVMRMIALMISLLLPAAFIAVSNFHQEVIPVHLLFAIAASRQGVPFSTLTELILFEIAFEIIREASVRIPASAGNAMGIIGGLIIGQAAVDANIVKPNCDYYCCTDGNWLLYDAELLFEFCLSDYKVWVYCAGSGWRIFRAGDGDHCTFGTALQQPVARHAVFSAVFRCVQFKRGYFFCKTHLETVWIQAPAELGAGGSVYGIGAGGSN